MKKYDVDIVSLANCPVLAEDGQEVQFGSLWQRQTTLFVFLRHFACMACRAHVQQMLEKRAELEAKGTRLVFIGNGQAHFILKFKEQLGIPEAEIYTDPSLKSFRAAGFKRGFLASHGPQSVVNTVKLLVSGQKATPPASGSGDLWQLGGLLLMLPNGKVGYQFISQALGDFGPENDLQAEKVLV